MAIFLVLFVVFIMIAMINPTVFKYLIFVPILGLTIGGMIWVVGAIFIPQMRTVEGFAGSVLLGIFGASFLFEALIKN